MTQPKRFLTIATFFITLVAFGSASANDVVNYSKDTVHLSEQDGGAEMRVTEFENVTVYGDDWEQVVPGVMERHSENGYIRHIFGEDGLAWKIRSLTDEAHDIRFKADQSPDDRAELAKLEARIAELEGLAQNYEKSVRIGGPRLDPCSPRDFTLYTHGDPPYYNSIGENYLVKALAVTNNYGSVCTASGSASAYVRLSAHNNGATDTEYWSGHQFEAVGHMALHDFYPIVCYEYEATAIYEDNRYFEVTEVGASVPCW